MENLIQKLDTLVNTIEKVSKNEEINATAKQIQELKDAIAKANTLSEEDKEKIAKFDEVQNEMKKMAEKLDEIMKGKDMNFEKEDELVKFEKELNSFFKTGVKSELITKAFNTTTGEVLIPKPRAKEILKVAVEMSPVLKMAKRYSVSNGNTLTIPVRKTGTRRTAAQAEGVAYGTASDLTYEKLELKVGKVTDYVNVTSEMIDDSDFNVLAEVRETLVENMGHYISEKVWNGELSANNEIEGIYKKTAFTSTALETNGPLTWEHLKEMIYRLPQNIRTGCYFIVSTDALSEMRGFKDANGRPLYIEPLTAGEPGIFMGYKVYEDPYMQPVTDDNFPVFFGNMKKFYAWLDKKEMYMEKSRHAKEDTWDFILRTRLGGRVAQTEYATILKKTAGLA